MRNLAKNSWRGWGLVWPLLALWVGMLQPSESKGMKDILPGKTLDVSFDHRALLLDGQRVLFISAGIHYARSTPGMWPSILAKSKAGGANLVQTYMFWDVHEPIREQYDFTGRYDVVRFAKECAKANLFLNVRIGPYACAEWNLGGFPRWLVDTPGMECRTDNALFKAEMQRFMRYVVELFRSNHLFAWQGGPIILAQVENEYGNFEQQYGTAGHRYAQWAPAMAQSLNASIPWIMCQQWDAPPFIINTCNSHYCDGFRPTYWTTPIFWTEHWVSWFTLWGQAVPKRTAEDSAFAGARFFARGGTLMNYYMYHGGTSFNRTVGGPFIITSYDYDGALDEYGLPSEPKYSHFAALHDALFAAAGAMLAVDEPLQLQLGFKQEAHIYTELALDVAATTPEAPCAAFLSNVDDKLPATVHFMDREYELPAWSVSILPDCKTDVYNTAKVKAPTTIKAMTVAAGPVVQPPPHIALAGVGEVGPQRLEWGWQRDVVGAWGETVVAERPQELIHLTHDKTDYLWYSRKFQVPATPAGPSKAVLLLTNVGHAVHVFLNGELQGSSVWGSNLRFPITYQGGNATNELDLLVMTVGLWNYGFRFEQWTTGLLGRVYLVLTGTPPIDLTVGSWVHQVGVKGESLRLFSHSSSAAAPNSWTAGLDNATGTPLTWYKTTFASPPGDDPVALDLASMGKGFVWVNGYNLGRYWTSMIAPETGCTEHCDYRGTFRSGSCRKGCGTPTQRWYHVPRDWLSDDGNVMVLFEEEGGDPAAVSVVTRTVHTVCRVLPFPDSPVGGSATDLDSTRSLAVDLSCGKGQRVNSIDFASLGTPGGTCGAFRIGRCHSPSSEDVVRKACLGKTQCAIPMPEFRVGASPCPGGTRQVVAVQVTCSPLEQLSGTFEKVVLDTERVPRDVSSKRAPRWLTRPKVPEDQMRQAREMSYMGGTSAYFIVTG